MQTVPAYNPQSTYQISDSFIPSNYPIHSHIDPRVNTAYNNSFPQPSYSYNYQSYNNQWPNSSYSPYYGIPRDKQTQRISAQYINPSYHHEYDQRYSNNRDARYHQRVETYNLPIDYSNSTGRFPTRAVKDLPKVNPNAPIKQVIYEQQPLNIPESVTNVQYIPKLHQYMDYVQERMKIPVEKYYTDYYEVEHVTDFIPREYEDTVIEMVPEEIVRYRLEYVPVERKIVHLPKNQLYDEKGLFKAVTDPTDKTQIDQAAIGLTNQLQVRGSNEVSRTIQNNRNRFDGSLVDVIGKDIQNKIVSRVSPSLQEVSRMVYEDKRENVYTPTGYGYSKEQITGNNFRNMDQSNSRTNSAYGSSRVSRRKTNFVTSDGYFPVYDGEVRNL